MKWMTRYFTLPILLSLSLTSVSIAVLYVLYKKEEEDIKFGKSHVKTSKTYVTEYKVPKQFVPAIIGRGGSMIKDIQNKTGTQLHFKDDIECPDRICIIKGGYEAVHLAEEMIKSIIQNQPIIETYEMFIPQKTCGKIIGKGGEIVQQIQTMSSAKIMIENTCGPYEPNSERKVLVKGTTKQIAAAMAQIQDKIDEEKEIRAKIEAFHATTFPTGNISLNTFNTSKQVYSTESLPVSDGLIEVYVSSIENPSQFWVQIVGPGITALDELTSEMTTYYENKENYEMHRLKNVTIGRMVTARYSYNKQWYRGEIISILSKDVYEVFFVDYGNREVVDLDNILELRTDFLRLRLQAIECSMANLKPPKSKWTNQQSFFFTDLTFTGECKILSAKVKGYKKRTCGKSQREDALIPCIELYIKGENWAYNIGKEMINKGHADPEILSSTASSTSSLCDEIGIPSPVSTSPKPTLSSEMSAKTSDKSDSPDPSFMSLETKSSIPCRTSSPSIKEIDNDLITPQKPVKPIEEIDLVTPAKDEANREDGFIESEKEIKHESEKEIKHESEKEIKHENEKEIKHENEKEIKHENVNDRDDCYQNEAGDQSGKPRIRMPVDKFAQIAPAGYESDLSDASDASDDLTLG